MAAMTEKQLKKYRAARSKRNRMYLEILQETLKRRTAALEEIKVRVTQGYFSLTTDERAFLKEIIARGL